MMTYTCPMHPEIREEKPGRCPTCGMALVPASSVQATSPPVTDRGLGKLTWRSYIPLIVIFSLLILSAAVVSRGDYLAGQFSLPDAVSYFMAGFFIVFAGFKLMDIEGFAHGYVTYDLLAQRIFSYGYVYPFIELGFGLAMLAGAQSLGLLWAEVLVMAFSGIGVLIKIAKREEIQCVCLGTFLKVPLTNITLIEDLGMAALALFLIVNR